MSLLSVSLGWIVCAVAVFMAPTLPPDERFSAFAIASAMWLLVVVCL